MFSFEVTKNGKDMEQFLTYLQSGNMYSDIDGLAQEGVAALSRNTPKDSGLAASSWSYRITNNGKQFKVEWINTNREGGHLVVILLQYGHGTGTGGYVQGRDFINPSIQPIFDKIEERVWKAVTSA